MLIIRTGLPGSGKTLNAIKEIDTEQARDPENPGELLHPFPDHPEVKPRKIYYYGIPELKTEKLKAEWIEFDSPEEWYNLPDGSVVVIDEAQKVFGTDLKGRPPRVARFETHRHQGLDIHLITQHPMLLFSPIRKLAGKHINMYRPYGRTKGVFRHEYEMCINSPEKRANFSMAQETKVTFDPSYYGLYKSSTVHTHKKRTPSYYKTIPIAFAFLVICGLILFFGIRYMTKNNNVDEKASADSAAVLPEQQKGGAVPMASGSVPANRHVTAKEYNEDRKPRIPDVASSAPRYDEITKPRDFPRPQCISSTDPGLVSTAAARGVNVGRYNGQPVSCQCYSQQMTRMDTSIDFCMSVVRNGYFDDTQMQSAIAQPGSSQLATKSSRSKPYGDNQPEAAPQRREMQVTVISDSGKSALSRQN